MIGVMKKGIQARFYGLLEDQATDIAILNPQYASTVSHQSKDEDYRPPPMGIMDVIKLDNPVDEYKLENLSLNDITRMQGEMPGSILERWRSDEQNSKLHELLPDSLQVHNEVAHGDVRSLINLDLAPLVRECAGRKATDAQVKAASHIELDSAFALVEGPPIVDEQQSAANVLSPTDSKNADLEVLNKNTDHHHFEEMEKVSQSKLQELEYEPDTGRIMHQCDLYSIMGLVHHYPKIENMLANAEKDQIDDLLGRDNGNTEAFIRKLKKDHK